MVRSREVSRSDHCVWIDRKPPDRMIRRASIEQKAAWFHGGSDGVYGLPRILAGRHADA